MRHAKRLVVEAGQLGLVTTARPTNDRTTDYYFLPNLLLTMYTMLPYYTRIAHVLLTTRKARATGDWTMQFGLVAVDAATGAVGACHSVV